MRNLTCIVCPIGCFLEVSQDALAQEGLSVTGNRCPRGAVYARGEIRAPKRVVTATCRISEETVVQRDGRFQTEEISVKRIPVKTASPCPREKISALLDDIHKAAVSLPVKAGDVVIAGWNGTEIDVIATRTLG